VFAALVAFAAWRYAGTESDPPSGRVIVIVALSLAGAAAVGAIDPGPGASTRMRALAVAARMLVLVALLIGALLAAGVPAHLLRPARWGTLAHDVHRGGLAMAATLWPYVGSSRWARVDILLVLAATLIAAAALAFWPAHGRGTVATARRAVRQFAALALLLALYVDGVIDGPAGSATAEGLVLLALIAAWLWLPAEGRARADGGRLRWPVAVAWLAAGGAAAALLAGSLASRNPWLNYRAWELFGPGPGTAFTWEQTYGPIHWSRGQQVMFTVKGSAPQLWKTTTLDRFDGLRFVRSGVDAPAYQDLPTPTDGRWYRFATFTIQGLSSQLLPTGEGTTIGVNVDRLTSLDRDGTARAVGGTLRSGYSYTALSYSPSPTPTELRAASRTYPAAYLRYTAFDLPTAAQSGLDLPKTDRLTPGTFYTARTVRAPAPGLLPAAAPGVAGRILSSPYAPMYRLARRIAGRSRSPYDTAVATEAYLLGNYSYSERPPARRYPLEAFLFRDRIGHCQQFSAAMALMLRMDGIPARVAAGFLPGIYDPQTRTSKVRAVDAHSWVEVYFTDYGWVPFNPTPPRALPVPSGPQFPSERSAALTASPAATIGSLPVRPRGRLAPLRRVTGKPGGGVAVAALITAGVALAVLMAAFAAWLSGHRRLRRSLRGDGELAARELVAALRRLGYAIPATATLAQIERRVRIHATEDAARYVRLLRDRRYARAGDRSATLRDRRRLRLGLTAHLGLEARLRGLLAFPPGTTRSGRRLG
jgi:transglutaminase-like putative cysteine protease